MAVLIAVSSTVFTVATKLTTWDVPNAPGMVTTVKMDERAARSELNKILCINSSIIMA